MRLVWGGDWNHALSGREYAGSLGGRKVVLDAVDQLDLSVPTADLPHPIDGLLSIDHVAVPRGTATTASRLPAERDGTRLSDHDAYVVRGLHRLGGSSSDEQLGRPTSAW